MRTLGRSLLWPLGPLPRKEAVTFIIDEFRAGKKTCSRPQVDWRFEKSEKFSSL
jgi:hypothetical protein